MQMCSSHQGSDVPWMATISESVVGTKQIAPPSPGLCAGPVSGPLPRRPHRHRHLGILRHPRRCAASRGPGCAVRVPLPAPAHRHEAWGRGTGDGTACRGGPVRREARGCQVAHSGPLLQCAFQARQACPDGHLSPAAGAWRALPLPPTPASPHRRKGQSEPQRARPPPRTPAPALPVPRQPPRAGGSRTRRS